MKRREYEDFVGFKFGKFHSSEFGIKAVVTSGRYDKNLLPAPQDYTQDIPGSDGQYYFGSVFKDREFPVSLAFDGITEDIWRLMSQTFSTDKLQDLVFDELPFKTYKAKVKSKPEFKFVCFFDREKQQRVYKGEGKLTFVCYYPYAFGFDKYVVRAADNYYTPHKEVPIDPTIQSKYRQKPKEKPRSYTVNEHYNTSGNMNIPWKSGFPTLEQVQQGELYFNEPDGDKKLIIDTRAYWNNVPEWQDAAKLLVSPTLDYDNELIFLPQYSKINYYNMDTGLNKENGLIGSRLLVYNPGDLPVEFELKLGNLSSRLRRNLDEYTFRISRYNVQRLTIEQAVDWTGLTTFYPEDNVPYKYGDKYFKIIETSKDNNGQDSCDFQNIDSWHFEPDFRDLKCAHPKHTYIVEPIPREKLAHFIKLFYWQNNNGQYTADFEKGVAMADRYQELYDQCQTDDEIYELYWKTLSDLFVEFEEQGLSFYDYIYNPPEFFIDNEDLNYGEFIFNKNSAPLYYTYDYFDISNEGFEDIQGGEININNVEDAQREYTLPLLLDSDRRMLYNINKNENFYNFNLTKTIHNENIKKGHWFKIPKGWSLIDISPVIDKDKWGGKRWLDARPFDWGNTNPDYQAWYNKVYQTAAIDYLSYHITRQGILKGNADAADSGSSHFIDATLYNNPSRLKEYFSELELWELENYMQFARWYDYDTKDIYDTGSLLDSVQKAKADQAELGFLKLLANYWRVNLVCNGKPKGSVDDWWWYANNYIWENFPPLYWGYADLLNKAEISYVPLFF